MKNLGKKMFKKVKIQFLKCLSKEKLQNIMEKKN